MSLAALLADYAARPGIDTRGWFLNGTVDIGTEQDRSVQYRDVNGKRMAPLVNVRLHPSNVRIPCRVLGPVAGNGESSWFPFVDGDEVVIGIPGGDERNGAFIIGRANNDLDVFPETVGGLPTDANNFAFTRMRTSYVMEVDGGFLIRSAKTGAQLGFTQDGMVILNDGAGNRLFMSPDGSGLGTKKSDDGKTAFVQTMVESQQVLLGAGGLTLLLQENESQLLTPGTLSLGTSGVGATGHAVTLEQLTSILTNLLVLLASSGAFGAVYGPAFAGGFPGTLLATLGAAIQASATPAPVTGPTPGGDLTLTGIKSFIDLALATQGADPAADSLTPIFRPGVGRPGLKF